MSSPSSHLRMKCPSAHSFPSPSPSAAPPVTDLTVHHSVPAELGRPWPAGGQHWEKRLLTEVGAGGAAERTEGAAAAESTSEELAGFASLLVFCKKRAVSGTAADSSYRLGLLEAPRLNQRQARGDLGAVSTAPAPPRLPDGTCN